MTLKQMIYTIKATSKTFVYMPSQTEKDRRINGRSLLNVHIIFSANQADLIKVILKVMLPEAQGGLVHFWIIFLTFVLLDKLSLRFMTIGDVFILS